MEVSEVLRLIATASQDHTSLLLPAHELPLLTAVAHCTPDRKGNFQFTFPLRAGVTQCSGPERIVALLLLLLLLPLLVVVALLILLFDGRPVIFRQTRVGCGERSFTLLKFRTMQRESEALHNALLRERGHNERPFKLERDPRVTRFGALLRRTFLDELPQLWNVVRGEMRMVGPRPLPASDNMLYTLPCHKLRLAGMPGLTGLWQVSGRHKLTFEEMCLLDIYYLCNRSARLDLSLIIKTPRAICQHGGLGQKADATNQ